MISLNLHIYIYIYIYINKYIYTVSLYVYSLVLVSFCNLLNTRINGSRSHFYLYYNIVMTFIKLCLRWPYFRSHLKISFQLSAVTAILVVKPPDKRVVVCGY